MSNIDDGSLYDERFLRKLSVREIDALVTQVFAEAAVAPEVDEAEALWTDEPALEFEDMPDVDISPKRTFAYDVVVVHTREDLQDMDMARGLRKFTESLASRGYQVVAIAADQGYIDDLAAFTVPQSPLGQVYLLLSASSALDMWDMWKAVIPVLLTQEGLTIASGSALRTVLIQRNGRRQTYSLDGQELSSDKIVGVSPPNRTDLS